ncbi:MAG: clan AA aspartic protease [Acidobacteria bacterium]|nr:clan AA aspartic protease [Acidobacteriota bacterium]
MADVRRATVKAVVDTAAVMLALPEDIVARLGVEAVGGVACAYADARRGERPVAGPLTVRIGDRSMPANCLVLPAGTDVLVGQVVMEQFDLVADCVTGMLGPRPESPDRPLLRL